MPPVHVVLGHPAAWDARVRPPTPRIPNRLALRGLFSPSSVSFALGFVKGCFSTCEMTRMWLMMPGLRRGMFCANCHFSHMKTADQIETRLGDHQEPTALRHFRLGPSLDVPLFPVPKKLTGLSTSRSVRYTFECHPVLYHRTAFPFLMAWGTGELPFEICYLPGAIGASVFQVQIRRYRTGNPTL